MLEADNGSVAVQEVTGDLARLLLLRAVLIGSGVVAPLAGVNPHTLTDDALTTATPTCHLVRIDRTEPRTGAAGPGAHAWVSPQSTALLLLARLCRQARARAHGS